MSIADKIILLYSGKPTGYRPTFEEVHRVNEILQGRSKAKSADDTSSEQEITERFGPSGGRVVIDVSDDSDDNSDDDFQKPMPVQPAKRPSPVPTSIFCASVTDEQYISKLHRQYANLEEIDITDPSKPYHTLQAHAVPSVQRMIPIANSMRCSITVQGIYECFKVYKSNPFINPLMLQTQEKIMRKELPKDLIGWQLGEKKDSIVSYEDAHNLYFILPYFWVLRTAHPIALQFMRQYLRDGKKLLLLDKSTNFNIQNHTTPYP